MSNFNIAYLIELKDRYTAVAKRVAEANEKIRSTIGTLDTKLGAFSTKLGSLKDGFGKVRQAGQEAFIGWSVPVGLAIGGIVKLGAELEDTRIGMTTMLGSADKANKLIADVQKMGAVTPFESKDLLRSTKMLLNFGVPLNNVMKDMQMLGDVSGGNVERFNGLTLAFSQMSSQGRLMGQDLMQMVNAGFNPLQTISKKTGKSMGELKDMMSKGGITAKMVTQALEIETSKGGRFYQYMAKNSKTFNGLMSTLADTISMTASSIGEKMLPYFKPLVIQLTNFTSILTKISPQTMIWIIALTGLSALLPVLMVTIGFLGQAFISFQMTMVLLNSGVVKLAKAVMSLNLTFLTSPIFWIVVGVVALVAVLVLAYQKCEWFRNVVQMLWLGLQILWAGIKLLALTIWQALTPAFQTAWGFIQSVGGAIANLWGKISGILAPVLNFGKFLFLWCTPLGLIIQLVMTLVQNFDKIVSAIGKAKEAMTKFKAGLDDSVVKAEGQIKAEQVKNQNTVNGEIKVKAEKGSSVSSTKVKTTGRGAKIGLNRAHSGG